MMDLRNKIFGAIANDIKKIMTDAKYDKVLINDVIRFLKDEVNHLPHRNIEVGETAYVTDIESSFDDRYNHFEMIVTFDDIEYENGNKLKKYRIFNNKFILTYYSEKLNLSPFFDEKVQDFDEKIKFLKQNLL